MRVLAVTLLAGLFGCATKAAAPVVIEPEPPARPGPPLRSVAVVTELPGATTTAEPPVATPVAGLGASKDAPLPACGVTASYMLVADTECADGSRPLAGSISRGRDSRRGSLGANEDGHIIDLYAVPCGEGEKRVYVDMYDCENARPSRSEVEAEFFITDVFLVGDFTRLIERCLAEEAHGPGHASAMTRTCVATMPTALRLSGKRSEGSALLAHHCGRTPPPSDDEPTRWIYLANVIEAHVALGARKGVDAAGQQRERDALLGEYAGVCSVDAGQYTKWFAANHGP